MYVHTYGVKKEDGGKEHNARTLLYRIPADNRVL